ncbi:hypothetical protein ACIBQ0_35755 [Nocardia nova]|uniref:hypothetical protein n=1 Tax=Nocardia nova TaxID=37330 RepID=UPI0037AB42C0
MDHRTLSSPGYQLVWPQELFAKEASRLINERFDLLPDAWSDACELLLADAFITELQRRGPLADFQKVPRPSTTTATLTSTCLTGQHLFLRDLLRNQIHLQQDPRPRRPLYRERAATTSIGPTALTQAKTFEQMIEVIDELDKAGYFDGLFGELCVDEPRAPGPEKVLQKLLEVEAFRWPMTADDFSVWRRGAPEIFYDVVEYLHDHAARPRRIDFDHHGDWNQHCVHHSDYDPEVGQAVYRWRMNKILERSEIGLRLSETGTDAGTLVAAPPDAGRAELLEALTARTDNDAHDADDVQRGISLFRARSAGPSDKRAAIALLYRALERRRHNVVEQALNGADAQPLFHIANKFNLRHHKADQHRDYPDYYLDWVFWMYLSTIELTNRIIDDQAPSGQ